MAALRPVMSDARAFSDYTSASELNAKIMMDNKISDSSAYRAFLQKNGMGIVQNSRKLTMCTNFSDCKCAGCIAGGRPFAEPVIINVQRASKKESFKDD